jgi:hypothetical protein
MRKKVILAAILEHNLGKQILKEGNKLPDLHIIRKSLLFKKILLKRKVIHFEIKQLI